MSTRYAAESELRATLAQVCTVQPLWEDADMPGCLPSPAGDAVVPAPAPAEAASPAPPAPPTGKSNIRARASSSALAAGRGEGMARQSAQAAGDAGDSSLHQVTGCLMHQNSMSANRYAVALAKTLHMAAPRPPDARFRSSCL